MTKATEEEAIEGDSNRCSLSASIHPKSSDVRLNRGGQGGQVTRRATSTSAFGVGRRENHDASAFYERFNPPAISTDSLVTPCRHPDRIICGDARQMDDVEANSVALVVTSPPYFAGKEYEADLGRGDIPASYIDYLKVLQDVFAECWRVLEPGGRVAVNVANLGRKPYRSLAADVTGLLQDELGFLPRGEIIWIKGRARAVAAPGVHLLGRPTPSFET